MTAAATAACTLQLPLLCSLLRVARSNPASQLPPPGAFTVSICEIVSWLPPRGRAMRQSIFADKATVGEALLATGTVPWLLAGWFKLSRRFQGRDVRVLGIPTRRPLYQFQYQLQPAEGPDLVS